MNDEQLSTIIDCVIVRARVPVAHFMEWNIP